MQRIRRSMVYDNSRTQPLRSSYSSSKSRHRFEGDSQRSFFSVQFRNADIDRYTSVVDQRLDFDCQPIRSPQPSSPLRNKSNRPVSGRRGDKHVQRSIQMLQQAKQEIRQRQHLFYDDREGSSVRNSSNERPSFKTHLPYPTYNKVKYLPIRNGNQPTLAKYRRVSLTSRQKNSTISRNQNMTANLSSSKKKRCKQSKLSAGKASESTMV